MDAELPRRCPPESEDSVSKFSIYLVGYVIFVAGVCLAAWLLGLAPMWIMVIALVLVGIGVFAGANSTKRDDPSPDTR